MKKYLPFLIIPFTVCADTCTLYQEGGGDWRIVCEGSGIDFNYVDVTNEVFVIQNCEELKSSLLSSVSSINSSSVNILFQQRNIDDALYYAGQDQAVSTNASFQYFVNVYNQEQSVITPAIDKIIRDTGLYGPQDNLYNTINNIECGTCPTNGASGGGSGGACCDVDFTDIIDRLIIAEQQRAAISNQIARISNYLGVVTNQIAYNNFLLEHGFGSVTNLLIDSLFYNSYRHEDMLGEWNTYHFQDFTSRNWEEPSYTVYEDAPFIALFNAHYYNQLQGLLSANNYNYNWQYRIFPSFTNEFSSYRRDFSSYSDETTNFFSFFRGEIGVRGVLEDWTSEQVDGTYHDFLTNHYINVVRGGSLSGYQAEKTNWFARIETLLASLVFLDSSNTNSYNEAAASVSNSISRVKDDFNDKLEGVSSASSTQMELVSDIEKSMYESLQSFSKAFSSASLPSTVQLLYVHKTSGAKSLPSSDSVDVTVPVEGNLMDFIEIIRSCTTLCWVFFGLWFMFKFSVWTVKKIYMLIRYIIDFFNMVAGGK